MDLGSGLDGRRATGVPGKEKLSSYHIHTCVYDDSIYSPIHENDNEITFRWPLKGHAV